MDEIIYSKTGKGLSAINTGTPKLHQIPARVLAHIDGTSSAAAIHRLCPEYSGEEMESALDWLLRNGYAKALFSDSQEIHSSKNICVTTLDPEKSVLEWAKAQRLAKCLANDGYCSTECVKHPKPDHPSILIVEDELQLALLEVAILEGEGYRVSHVNSGALALEKLKGGDLPHAVILDVVLPGIDGFETLRTIRSMIKTASLPVVMVTAQVSDEDVMEGLIGGADGYIFKPFSPEKLTNYLLEVLGWR